MTERLEVSLCMGSSCFARGNERFLEEIEEIIRQNAWEDKVSLTGTRCENCCREGPNVKIDGISYRKADSGMILDLLLARLGNAEVEHSK